MVAASVSGTAHAHEFIAKPGSMTVQAGRRATGRGSVLRRFPHQPGTRSAKDVKVGFYADGKRTDIAVKPNEKTLTFDGTMTAPSSATFIDFQRIDNFGWRVEDLARPRLRVGECRALSRLIAGCIAGFARAGDMK